MPTLTPVLVTARNAVNAALSTLGPQKKRLNALPGAPFTKLQALPGLLDKLETVKRLLGDRDAVKGTKAETFKSLYQVRGVLLRRAQSDADFNGKIITRQLLDAVEPGRGPRDAINDVVRLATAYLKPGAPKTPYSPAELKASLAAAQKAVAGLGVDAINADRDSLIAQRDGLNESFRKSWRLIAAASELLDAVDDTETDLASPYEKKRKKVAKVEPTPA